MKLDKNLFKLIMKICNRKINQNSYGLEIMSIFKTI